MPTTAEADEAARVIKRVQPQLDALKEESKANDAAKKTLGAYMVEKGLDVYRGVSMRVVEFDGWDNDRLRAFIVDQGAKVDEFRAKRPRHYFNVIGRRRQR